MESWEKMSTLTLNCQAKLERVGNADVSNGGSTACDKLQVHGNGTTPLNWKLRDLRKI